MRPLSITEATGPNKSHGRTTVIHQPSPSAAERFRELVARISAHIAAASRRMARNITARRVLLTVAIMLALFLAVSVYYYQRFAAEIDSRLQAGQLDNSAEIVSAPLKLTIGDRFAVDELAGYLRAAGYQEHAS